MTNFSAPGGNETDATTPASEDPFMYDEYPNPKLQAVREDVQDSPVDVYAMGEPEESETVTRIRKAVPAARIKSVGNAPRRSTPRPIKTNTHLTRGSIYIEPILIPPKPEGMPEAVQDLGQSVASNYSSALRDSDVFGSQDVHVRYS
jgi:hypothetical protein